MFADEKEEAQRRAEQVGKEGRMDCRRSSSGERRFLDWWESMRCRHSGVFVWDQVIGGCMGSGEWFMKCK